MFSSTLSRTHRVCSIKSISSSTTPGLTLLPATTRPFSSINHKMAPSSNEKQQAKEQGSKSHEVEGEENEWKFKAPYKVHEKDSGFKKIYDASCHCGKVRYELGREKPLDAKFCHCTTCQVIHGMSLKCSMFVGEIELFDWRTNEMCYRSTLPMGRHLQEGRHQLHARPS